MGFKTVCSEEVLLPVYIQKKLKCRYVEHSIPFLKIAPFKEEEVYLEPRIVVYHDVIHEDEIEAFKRLAKPKLKSAKVRNFATGKKEPSTGRIAKNAYLENDENEHIQLLRRRVQHMTGLTVDTAERLHISYYTIGGFYLPHFDAVHEEDKNSLKEFGTGNRIATVLFYMNDVAKGGSTVFPALNFTIKPKKGSAVFWYNLKRNGEIEYLAVHGACWVLSGTKWISTIWLHEHGQEFRRPCTLLEDE
ncbi:prolyl 4-hydroxylase subunit alpha-2-like [Belonocnema kinseyi]|uniref:prolyl 4-hydroxylase subunit alpha-2-like n=1 Tax=Belonocnema kinseyi TaxID=2817044 RepID=UPI00143D4D5B|nr:prolyl 4-hydroxylase subunit alpha-2-like [Belonocnema kinseyi]